MAKKSAPAATPAHEPDSLAMAVDRLTSELVNLRQVIDEIREDFSWLTRNGLPVQPIEHVHVKRMALDPCAADWGDRLEIERSTYYPRGAISPLDSVALDQITDDLKTTFEAVAQGQLEVVLTALDGVRAEILAALKRKRGSPPEDTARPTTLLLALVGAVAVWDGIQNSKAASAVSRNPAASAAAATGAGATDDRGSRFVFGDFPKVCNKCNGSGRVATTTLLNANQKYERCPKCGGDGEIITRQMRER